MSHEYPWLFWHEGNIEQRDFLEGACASFDPHVMRGFPKDLTMSLQKNFMQYQKALDTAMSAASHMLSLGKLI